MLGERLGGLLRAARAYTAVVPLAIPLILASFAGGDSTQATDQTRASLALGPAIRYDLLKRFTEPLPPHSNYLAVEDGDTLDSVFLAGGLSSQEAHALTTAFCKSIDPKRLRPGTLVRFHYDSKSRCDEVELKIAGWGSVHASRKGESFADTFETNAYQAPEREEQATVSARVDSSLYDAIRESGESPQLVQQLVDIFQWDVDFFALQKGDWFSIVVNRRYVGDDRVGYSPILAATFYHEGSTYQAYRFESSIGNAGYYTHDGTPVRKQFLKAPLKFTRITSGFSHHRFHPVLHTFRPHNGIDYGAPVGTPVMSTADGVVEFAAYKGGEGNFVRIRHNSHIETGYLHLSRFAKGLHAGSKVKQGDVIGYVGMTGLATGPHLDYRVCDSGRWLNPLELKSITPDPLRADSLRRFRDIVARFDHQLVEPKTLVAAAHPEKHTLF